MDKETHFQKREHRLTPCAAVALALMLVLSVGGTVAYLSTATGSVTNTFTPTPVECSIVEPNWQNGKITKNGVFIQNTGKADAHIRAPIVVTWQDAAGNVYGQVPVEGEGKDYVLKINKSSWRKGSDGYWYCIAAGNPDDNQTAVLIDSCTALTSLDGYTLNVEILAQAIQAEPDAAAIAAWGEENAAGLAVIRAGGVQ